jgi:predicted alpha/beta-fold hydrolase
MNHESVQYRRAWPRVWSVSAALLVLLAGESHAQSLRAEEARFLSNQMELRGVLLLPAGQGPFPALVFLHGSGCSTRDDMRAAAETFVKRGYAGLLFDKRGCGAFQGDWTRASPPSDRGRHPGVPANSVSFRERHGSSRPLSSR